MPFATRLNSPLIYWLICGITYYCFSLVNMFKNVHWEPQYKIPSVPHKCRNVTIESMTPHFIQRTNSTMPRSLGALTSYLASTWSNVMKIRSLISCKWIYISRYMEKVGKIALSILCMSGDLSQKVWSRDIIE